jgi:recombination protein RecT
MNAPATTEKPRQDKAEKGKSSASDFRHQLEQRLDGFAEALPSHITPQRFKSIIMQAVMADPLLLAADRVSLFESCLAAANDGLLPDKKEGALVIYNTKLPKENKKDPDVWIKKVQWLPMVRGVLTKIYNTGKVKSADVGIVYGGDQFRYWKDDAGEHLHHEPAEDPDKSIIRRIYARVIMKDAEGGGTFAEVLDTQEVEKIRKASKYSERGPWVDWWDQMAIKSAIKRLAKRLPISRELEQVLSRDNFLYDMELQAQRLAGPPQQRKSLTHRLDDLAGGVDLGPRDREPVGRTQQEWDDEAADANATARRTARTEQEDRESEKDSSRRSDSDGDSTQKQTSGSTAADTKSPSGESPPYTQASDGDAPTSQEAYEAGQQARAKGVSRKAVPQRFSGDEHLLEQWLAGFDGDVDEREPGEEG